MGISAILLDRGITEAGGCGSGSDVWPPRPTGANANRNAKPGMVMPGWINTRAEHPTYGPKTKGDVRADKGGPNKTTLAGMRPKQNQHKKTSPSPKKCRGPCWCARASCGYERGNERSK